MAEKPVQALSGGALKLIEAANKKKKETGCSELGVHHWLMILIERQAAAIEAAGAGINIRQERVEIMDRLRAGDPGALIDQDTVVRTASINAAERGSKQVQERDITLAVLKLAGYEIPAPDSSQPGMTAQGNSLVLTLPQVEAPSELKMSAHSTPRDSVAGTGSGSDGGSGSGSRVDVRPASPAPVAVRAKSTTPTLDQFGRDLNEEARTGKLVRVVGRDEEIQLAIETLCRRTKRNPVLVGPAGVGKTAIAEGLAYRVIEGTVPAMLKDARIIALHPSMLTAGAGYTGELEKRMKAIMAEASQEGIILFIDEIHTIMGAGGMMGTTDIASILKPTLARGNLAVIAATTDEEYRRYIEHDSALERRFQPIRINEVSPEITTKILEDLNVELGKKHNISVAPGVINFLINFAQQFMRNRHFPDKGIDLLEQCFAHAITQNASTVDLAGAQVVAQRMVGMPLSLDKRLDNLRDCLDQQAILPSKAVSQLLDRLQVTLRGLDLRTTRPNAVVLLSGDAAHNSERLAGTIAEALFGSPDRVITIDFSRMWHAEDINLLVGAPPGYVGYSDSLPLHKLAQTPWCVLRFENIDACHPNIRETIAQGFYDGWIMDGRGKPMYLSDTVVLMTADIKVQNRSATGFLATKSETGASEVNKLVEGKLGNVMAEKIDLFIYRLEGDADMSKKWLEDHFIGDLTRRYQKQGIVVHWDDTTLSWILEQYKSNWTSRDWESWVDKTLSPMIIPYLPGFGEFRDRDITIRIEENQVKINEEMKGFSKS
jgi:ATP-dependent Clp protease ATP-binding subunit ClpC